MASHVKNKTLFIDAEAVSALELANNGILNPIDKLLNKKESESVYKSKIYNSKTFPFPFLLAPSGKQNQKVLNETKPGDKLNIVSANGKIGEIDVEEVFEIDPQERLRHIYGTDDLTFDCVDATFKRLGKLAVSGEFEIFATSVKENIKRIKEAKQRINAKHTTAIMMAANPLHRAHERLIRTSLDKTDLVVIFLLKPYNENPLPYEIRHKSIMRFVNNYLPKNRVIVVPLENSYIFGGHNEVILDAIVAQNYGCNRLVLGKNHSGVGMYYDHDSNRSIVDTLTGFDIEVEMISEYAYCNICSTLVSNYTCPHGQHHHITYRSHTILELIKMGLMPPAVLVRKEISALILAEYFKGRMKNIEALYNDILPIDGLLEKHNEEDFYIQLMKLYQTTSLT